MRRDRFRDLEEKVKAVEHPTEQELSCILSEYGVTKASLERDVGLVRDWLAKQPHLPADDVDDIQIERMLVRCKNSVVVTQRRLDDMYTVRSELPDFYSGRDPLGPEINQILGVVGLCVMPRLTADLNRVSIIRLLDQDLNKFSVESLIKVVQLGQDIIIREPPTLGDILIFDARGYTLAHGVGASPLLIRKSIAHVKRTYPARLTGMHILFPPAFADRILTVIRSFLPDKLASRIHTHSSLDTLLDYVPLHVLPKDFGGQERHSDELCDLWKKKLLSYREYFLHTEEVKSNEALRVEKRKENSPDSSLEGSFRKLDID